MSNVDYIEVFQGNGEPEQHYWRAKAGNHEIVAQSEGYTTRFDARRAAETTFPDAKIVELYPEAHQQ